jgi:uncharacterized membrane-anchored protein YitT (DUF2179 family)
MYKKSIKKSIIFFIGVLISALTYNIFVIPNNFVIGGVSGLAIVVNVIFKIDPVVFLYVVNVILLIVSYIFIGKDKTYASLIGSFLYPLLITFTAPIAKIIIPYINIDNILVTVAITGCLLGIGNAIIYKVGYSTGGGDVVMQLLNKYNKISEGKATLIMDIIIILLGGAILGLANVIYSSLIIVIETNLIDKVLIGISDCKMFFVYSKKDTEIRNYVIKNLNTGVTLFNTKGGYNDDDNTMLMVVVPNKDYYLFKESILRIDNEAFFVVSDCYEATGGVKRKNLPFI